MRRLVVSVLASLDGCYEGPGRDLSTMPFEDAFNDHNLSLIEQAGTLVYGSTWFADNWRHWAAVAADETQPDRERRTGDLVTAADSLVISDSFTIGSDDPWAATTRVVRRDEAPAEIERLKAAEGGDLLVFGSATTWNPLLAAGLVDELVVLVGPGLVGAGSRLYDGPPTGLRLLDAQVLPGSQLVALRYDAAP